MSWQSIFVSGNKFQQILDPAIECGAQPGQDCSIQPGDFVFAILIDLGALHFRAVGELVFTDMVGRNKAGEFDLDAAVSLFFHSLFFFVICKHCVNLRLTNLVY